ncbi:MAG: nuclear transport factor 2 family protein [Opitutales bacterium]
MTSATTESLTAQLQAACATFAAGDAPAIQQHLSENVRWNLVGERIIEGREALLAFCAEMASGGCPPFQNNHVTVTPERIIVQGQSAPDASEAMHYCDVFDLADGKIAAITSYIRCPQAGADGSVISEGEIRSQLQRFDEAVSRKDAPAMMADYDAGVTSFDVGSQHEGRDALEQMWGQCFPYFSDEIGIERKDTRILTGGDMALVYGYTRMKGTPDCPAAKSWLRMSACYRKTPDGWKVVHEHISYPTDCENEKPLYILD